MRCLAIAALLICCTSAFAQKWTRDKGIPPQPATEAYFGRVGTTILNALAPEWAKHLERLNGKLRVSLLIDRQGHIHSPKVVSTTSNRWVQETALHVLRTVKLPQMPNQVIVEQGHEPVHFEIEWGPFVRHDSGSNHALQPTATRCAFTFFMSKTVQQFASLAAGSRG